MAAMATTVPRPSRPANNPPTIPLPTIPVNKTRKSTSCLQAPSSSSRATSAPRTSGLRIPSTPSYHRDSSTPSPSPSPTPTPTLLSRSPSRASINSTHTLRKVVSINAFPQPPRGDSRLSFAPGSSVAATRSSLGKPGKTPSALSSGVATMTTSTPSLLNGSGEGKSIANARMSDGLISVSSPPHSRSSSAQDSYSTSATTYDDPLEASKSDAAPGSGPDSKGNVIVSVRVRPDAKSSDPTAEGGDWRVDGRQALVSCRGANGGDYHYDNVFTTQDDNSRVYHCIAKRLVRRVMEGYHGTVFAYGMTGTGKTFSMQGTTSSPGVIPLAITDIFSYIRETPSREFLLRVSFLEIYNEKIHDLLSMSVNGGVGQQEEIKLREDAKRGVYASPLKEEIVQSPTQLLRVISRGDLARRTASTQFNARSSRSHAVVQIVVESRERTVATAESKRAPILPGGVRVSTLSLIDLAGSEKAADTKERRTEGSHINKSLLTLGTVIARLSEQKKEGRDGKPGDKEGKHLPYRDSKLTRLLQGALSGNSLVSILCTISVSGPASGAAALTHMNETINTLKFALRAKNSIVSHAKKAEEALGAGGEGGALVLLEQYRIEIQELRAKLGLQTKNAKTEEERDMERDAEEERALEKEQELRREDQMLVMDLARTALSERINDLNRLILSSKSIGVNDSGSYSSLGMHPHSRASQLSSVRSSARSSMLTTASSRHLLSRSASVISSSSTIGRRSSAGKRISENGHGRPDEPVAEDEAAVAAAAAEYGDGTASLAAQNRALQADLADKNRYIATLEKRLLQARRASSSRTSLGFSGAGSGSKTIMVGEDHSVATLLKEKDAEIAELRARLDDKDHMLTALRSAARSRDSAAEAMSPTASSNRNSRESSGTPGGLSLQRIQPRNSDDDMSILDEMIQEEVDKGLISRSVRGSVRVADMRRPEGSAAAVAAAVPVDTESFGNYESMSPTTVKIQPVALRLPEQQHV